MQIELTTTEAQALLQGCLGTMDGSLLTAMERHRAMITAGAKLIHALDALEIEEPESDGITYEESLKETHDHLVCDTCNQVYVDPLKEGTPCLDDSKCKGRIVRREVKGKQYRTTAGGTHIIDEAFKE